MSNPYELGLDRNPANYVPLSPLTFIERSAFIYPKRISVIQGARQYTWKESYDRTRQLASSLIADAVNDALAQAQVQLKSAIDAEAKALGLDGILPDLSSLMK